MSQIKATPISQFIGDINGGSLVPLVLGSFKAGE